MINLSITQQGRIRKKIAKATRGWLTKARMILKKIVGQTKSNHILAEEVLSRRTMSLKSRKSRKSITTKTIKYMKRQKDRQAMNWLLTVQRRRKKLVKATWFNLICRSYKRLICLEVTVAIWHSCRNKVKSLPQPLHHWVKKLCRTCTVLHL